MRCEVYQHTLIPRAIELCHGSKYARSCPFSRARTNLRLLKEVYRGSGGHCRGRMDVDIALILVLTGFIEEQCVAIVVICGKGCRSKSNLRYFNA